MRAAAFRRGLGLLVLAVLLGGCATATKRQYLRHLSVTIAPQRPSAPATAVAQRGSQSQMATAETERSRP